MFTDLEQKKEERFSLFLMKILVWIRILKNGMRDFGDYERFSMLNSSRVAEEFLMLI